MTKGVATSIRRKQAKKDQFNVLAGLGYMGMIGWLVVVPVLLLAWLGRWLDARSSGGISWTLSLLLLGLVIGIWNAWRWIVQHGVIKQND